MSTFPSLSNCSDKNPKSSEHISQKVRNKLAKKLGIHYFCSARHLIISLQDGRWAAVEVKLGSREIEEGAEHLKKLASKIDTDKFPAPSFLMVLTGGEFAYRRADGVFVIPIGCLKD